SSLHLPPRQVKRRFVAYVRRTVTRSFVLSADLIVFADHLVLCRFWLAVEARKEATRAFPYDLYGSFHVLCADDTGMRFALLSCSKFGHALQPGVEPYVVRQDHVDLFPRRKLGHSVGRRDVTTHLRCELAKVKGRSIPQNCSRTIIVETANRFACDLRFVH